MPRGIIPSFLQIVERRLQLEEERTRNDQAEAGYKSQARMNLFTRNDMGPANTAGTGAGSRSKKRPPDGGL